MTTGLAHRETSDRPTFVSRGRDKKKYCDKRGLKEKGLIWPMVLGEGRQCEVQVGGT